MTRSTHKSINTVLTENIRRSSRISTKFNASVKEVKENTTVRTATKVSKRSHYDNIGITFIFTVLFQVNKKTTRATKKVKVEKTTIENEDGNRNGIGQDSHDIGKIVGATEDGGKLKFIFKWNDRDALQLVSSDKANLMYPYIVIDFYERCMVWENASDIEEDNDDDL